MKSIEKFKEKNGIKDNGLQEFFELTLTSYDFKEEVPFDNVGDQYYDLINENPEARMLEDRDILVLLKADAKQIEGFLEFKDPNTEKVLSIPINDSLNKRIKFLDEVIAQLGLKGISTVHGRAEDGGKSKELREQFDVSVSRAVADLSVLSEYNLPFVKVGGYFVAYKSGEIDEELEKSKKAILILGGQIEKVDKFKLPETDIERSLVYIKKVKNTPKKFPRKAGLPAKEPIG